LSKKGKAFRRTGGPWLGKPWLPKRRCQSESHRIVPIEKGVRGSEGKKKKGGKEPRRKGEERVTRSKRCGHYAENPESVAQKEQASRPPERGEKRRPPPREKKQEGFPSEAASRAREKEDDSLARGRRDCEWGKNGDEKSPEKVGGYRRGGRCCPS